MLRWAALFVIGLFAAAFLALFEPVAASDAGTLFYILSLIALFRSPLWISAVHSGAREGRT